MVQSHSGTAEMTTPIDDSIAVKKDESKVVVNERSQVKQSLLQQRTRSKIEDPSEVSSSLRDSTKQQIVPDEAVPETQAAPASKRISSQRSSKSGKGMAMVGLGNLLAYGKKDNVTAEGPTSEVTS